jgi:hypothetical protein
MPIDTQRVEGSYWSCKAIRHEGKYRKWRGNNFDVYLRKNYLKINFDFVVVVTVPSSQLG